MTLSDRIEYRMRIEKLRVGPFELEMEVLANLDETIDQVFRILENEGHPELLEKLCPYFGVIWPAGLGLARWMAQVAHSELEGKTVLELGCGLALPSLVASKRGARVTAADFHPEVPRFLDANKRRIGAPVEYLEADWMSSDSTSLGERRFDWVLASDVLYERHYPEAVARAFHRHAAKGATLILTDPGRPALQAFHDASKALGMEFQTRIISVPEGKTAREIFVLESQFSRARD